MQIYFYETKTVSEKQIQTVDFLSYIGTTIQHSLYFREKKILLLVFPFVNNFLKWPQKITGHVTSDEAVFTIPNKMGNCSTDEGKWMSSSSIL